jgi:hypothetical protein
LGALAEGKMLFQEFVLDLRLAVVPTRVVARKERNKLGLVPNQEYRLQLFDALKMGLMLAVVQALELAPAQVQVQMSGAQQQLGLAQDEPYRNLLAYYRNL